MNRYYISAPPMSPLGRFVAGILAVLAVIGTIVFGFFILALVLGLAVILILVSSVRRWWVRTRTQESQPENDPARRETIEAEYTVISRRHD